MKNHISIDYRETDEYSLIVVTVVSHYVMGCIREFWDVIERVHKSRCLCFCIIERYNFQKLPCFLPFSSWIWRVRSHVTCHVMPSYV